MLFRRVHCLSGLIGLACLLCMPRQVNAMGAEKDTILNKELSITFNTLGDGGNDSVSCVIPFSRAGNLILIKAKADSTEGNFILDTGSPCLVLNLTYFRDYPHMQLAEEDGGMAGTNARVLRTTVGQLSFDAITHY
ncbi:MAG: hypothetical protein ABW019_14890, partial [Chitinophagaceae bacterium]